MAKTFDLKKMWKTCRAFCAKHYVLTGSRTDHLRNTMTTCSQDMLLYLYKRVRKCKTRQEHWQRIALGLALALGADSTTTRWTLRRSLPSHYWRNPALLGFWVTNELSRSPSLTFDSAQKSQVYKKSITSRWSCTKTGIIYSWFLQ